jgi:ketosteroid isomerase-like protein
MSIPFLTAQALGVAGIVGEARMFGRLMIGAASLAIGGPALAGATAHKNDIAAITAIENVLSSAQDIETLSKSFDDNIAYYDIGNGSAFGLNAAKEEIGRQFKGVKNIRSRILDLNVYTDGRMGCAFSTVNFISDTAAGGPGPNFIFRETDVFVKKAGRWRLTHQHLSVPVDFATGRPIMSSKASIPEAKRGGS